MNRNFKKAISFLLSVVLIISVAVPAFAVYREGDELPIVYVIGKVDVIYADKDDPSSDVVYPVSMEKFNAVSAISTISSTWFDAYLAEKLGRDSTKEWDKYCDALYNVVVDLFGDCALGPDGEPVDNSGIIWDWPSKPLTDTKKAGQYGLYDYTFHYDWRLDMFYNASILNAYINEVLRVTGAPKCVLISRCYGCNLVTTYLNEYGSDKIDKNIFYCSTASGSVVCGEMFSGEMEMNPEGLDNYLTEALGFNPIVASLGYSIRELLPTTTAEKVSEFINEIYAKVAERAVPEDFLACFASMPGYWSMVNEDYYAKARQLLFGGKEKEYSNMLAKIDRYYYTITKNVERIILKNYVNGMKFANITKYGNQIVPAIKSSAVIGDGIVDVTCASMGATAVSRNQVFPEAYLERARIIGTSRYISPEEQIDASTCLFPDYTWFAEGVEHFNFPESVDKLIMEICTYDGQMTVYTNSKFPQYATYESDGNIVTYTFDQYLFSTDTTARIFAIINKIISIIKQYVALALKLASKFE